MNFTVVPRPNGDFNVLLPDVVNVMWIDDEEHFVILMHADPNG